VPLERWDLERAYAPDVATDKMYVRYAGFLTAVDAFDADAFRCVFLWLSLPVNNSWCKLVSSAEVFSIMQSMEFQHVPGDMGRVLVARRTQCRN